MILSMILQASKKHMAFWVIRHVGYKALVGFKAYKPFVPAIV